MGVCTGIVIEDFENEDRPIASTDEKGTTDIIGDILDSEDSLINTLAKKYNIDVSPFKMIPMDEDAEPIGPWQEPLGLWRAAHGLYQALEKDENNVLGKELFFREVTPEDLSYWKENLKDVIKFCKFAHENNKRVRFIIY